LYVTKLCRQKLTPGNLFRNKLKTGLSEELKGTRFHTVACNIKNVINENDPTHMVKDKIHRIVCPNLIADQRNFRDKYLENGEEN